MQNTEARYNMNAGMARLPRQCKFGCLVSVSFADRTERRSCDSCDCDELRNQIEVRDAGHFLDWKALVDEKVGSLLSPQSHAFYLRSSTDFRSPTDVPKDWR